MLKSYLLLPRRTIPTPHYHPGSCARSNFKLLCPNFSAQPSLNRGVGLPQTKAMAVQHGYTKKTEKRKKLFTNVRAVSGADEVTAPCGGSRDPVFTGLL